MGARAVIQSRKRQARPNAREKVVSLDFVLKLTPAAPELERGP